MSEASLDQVEVREHGLYCPSGDFYIDPWGAVDLALITHGHSDHARPGSRHYVAHRDCVPVLRLRLGEEKFTEVAYGEVLTLGSAKVSFHPSGHILGAAQIKIEHGGRVTVVSGDYKAQSDPTCVPIEPVPCHTFITESTFGLPIYRFPSQDETMAEVNQWWQQNKAEGKVSLLYAYSLGKAQRLLAGLEAIAPIYTHGAVEAINTIYRGAGVRLPQTTYLGESAQTGKELSRQGALVIAPPGQNPAWVKKLGTVSDAFASGWMMVRGQRRRRSLDRGFVMSDHADWRGLVSVIAATGAQRVLVTHGQGATLVRYLTEKGIDAVPLDAAYGEEQ